MKLDAKWPLYDFHTTLNRAIKTVYGNSLNDKKKKETRHRSRFTRILCFSEFHAIIRVQASQSISSILIAEGPGARLMNRRNRFCNRRMEIGATRRVLIEHKSSINRARIIERFLPIRAQSKDNGAGKTRHYITPLIARTSRVQKPQKIEQSRFLFSLQITIRPLATRFAHIFICAIAIP